MQILSIPMYAIAILGTNLPEGLKWENYYTFVLLSYCSMTFSVLPFTHEKKVQRERNEHTYQVQKTLRKKNPYIVDAALGFIFYIPSEKCKKILIWQYAQYNYLIYIKLIT